jgi:hypothetical protein
MELMFGPRRGALAEGREPERADGLAIRDDERLGEGVLIRGDERTAARPLREDGEGPRGAIDRVGAGLRRI